MLLKNVSSQATDQRALACRFLRILSPSAATSGFNRQAADCAIDTAS